MDRLNTLLNRIDAWQFIAGLTVFSSLVVYSIFVWLIQPKWQDYQHHKKLYEQFNRINQLSTSIESNIVSLKDENSNLEAELTKNQLTMPLQNLTAMMISKLEQLAKHHKLKITKLEPSHGQEIALFKKSIFDIDIEGQYPNLYAWTKAIESELNFIHIEKYQITLSKNKPGVISAHFVLNHYRNKDYGYVNY